MPVLTSLEDPAIQPYTTLKQLTYHPHHFSYTVAEGTKVVERLLRSPVPIISLLCTPEQYDHFQPLIQQKAIPDENVLIASRSLIEQIVGFKYHQGIMALLERPVPEKLAALSPPYVVLNGISNAENVGLITRSARSFGFTSLITDTATCSPFLRRAVRVSMGMCFEMRWHQTPNLSETIAILRDNGTTVIGVELLSDAQPLHAVALPANAAFIFGSEGDGIADSILQRCDVVVKIPTVSATHSLNVAMAATIALYEYRRNVPMGQ